MDAGPFQPLAQLTVGRLRPINQNVAFDETGLQCIVSADATAVVSGFASADWPGVADDLLAGTEIEGVTLLYRAAE